MNTPRINRFLGEWLDRQTSPDFFQKGLILLNACDFIESNADAIPGLIAHKKSPLRQQLDEALASRGFCYLKPIEVDAQDSIEVEKYYRFEATPKGSNEPIPYYGLGAYFICRAILRMNSILILAFNMMTKNSFMKTLDLMLYSIISLFFY